jgi:Uma2 family endonuclease
MASKTLLTLEQFEQLPDDGMRHELDEGELVSMPPTAIIHGKIQSRTATVLTNFVDRRSLGIVVTESGFQLSYETVRAPDVSFIPAHRITEANLDGRFEGAPDIAVEIISPSESASDIAHKVEQYLHAGAEVWVVYPRSRTVHVFEPSKSARVLEAADLLESPTLLPGFSVRVSELFA